jgi:hypothetical protein
MTRPKAKVWNWQELKWQTNYLLKVYFNQIYSRNQNQRCCFKDGTDIRKGAQDAAKKYCTESGTIFPRILHKQ